MIDILDVLEAGLDDGIVLMGRDNIVHESGDAVGTTQSLVEGRGHGGYLLVAVNYDSIPSNLS